MAFEGQTYLQDTKAQQDETDRPDQGKDEVTEVIDHLEGGAPPPSAKAGTMVQTIASTRLANSAYTFLARRSNL